MNLKRETAPRILLQLKVSSHIAHLHMLHNFPETFRWQKHQGRTLTVCVFSVISYCELRSAFLLTPIHECHISLSKGTQGPQQKGSRSSCIRSLWSPTLSTPVQNYGASCETFRRRT